MARHPAKLSLEAIQRLAERDEVEAVLADAAVGHRLPQDERLGVEALLRGALDVRGRGRVGQLDVGLGIAADGAGARRGGHAIDGVQIVDPALDRHEAAAVEAGAASGDDCGADGGLALGILGAVDEAAEIAPVPVAERIDLVNDVEQAVEARRECPPRVEQSSRIAVREVDPQRVLRRRERRQIVGERP